ncbi:HD family hydrolase [Candidatus Roizmanbacteria bacterium]|nr:HD family hydrolase [Candidatus Roizmanbacteria bacterium]
MEELIKIARTAGYLKRLRRTGWVRIGVQDAESVADHVYRTTLLCMLLTKKLNINHERLLQMALVHDLGETATSDIRYEEGAKVIASEEAKNKIEADVLQTLFSNLEDGNYYLELWYEFRDQHTEEAKLLKQIEKIEMALQAVEYQEIGLPADLTREFIENAQKYVTDPELKTFLSKIVD